MYLPEIWLLLNYICSANLTVGRENDTRPCLTTVMGAALAGALGVLACAAGVSSSSPEEPSLTTMKRVITLAQVVSPAINARTTGNTDVNGKRICFTNARFVKIHETCYLASSYNNVPNGHTCAIESLSRRVIVSFVKLSKSIVTQKGMPSSSARAYLRPTVPEELSKRVLILAASKISFSLFTYTDAMSSFSTT
jgi:hypothetical protein